MAKTQNDKLLVSPIQQAIPCGYCPRLIIFGQTELTGTLFRKGGRPICAVCRVMQSHAGGRIRADRKNFDNDAVAKKRHEAEVELDRVMHIAAESQEKAEKTIDVVKGQRRKFTI